MLHSKFILYYDHDALKHINSQDKLSFRHAKWVEYLQEFSFVLNHKSGVQNCVADAVRCWTSLLTIMHTQVFGFDYFQELLSTDPSFASVVEDVSVDSRSNYFMHDGFCFKENQLCVPDPSLRLKIIKELHNGHMGRDKMLQLVSRSYCWPTMC